MPRTGHRWRARRHDDEIGFAEHIAAFAFATISRTKRGSIASLRSSSSATPARARASGAKHKGDAPFAFDQHDRLSARRPRSDCRAGPGCAAPHQPHDAVLVLDRQHHDSSPAAHRRLGGGDEDDLAWRLSASRLADGTRAQGPLGAACDRAGRGKIGRQPIDGEDEALRDVDQFWCAIEVEHDIMDERREAVMITAPIAKAASNLPTRVKPSRSRQMASGLVASGMCDGRIVITLLVRAVPSRR